MYTTILTLYKQGKSQRSISKITKVHRKTVGKIISRYKESNIETPVPYNRASKLDEWHNKIMGLLQDKAKPPKIFNFIYRKYFLSKSVQNSVSLS